MRSARVALHGAVALAREGTGGPACLRVVVLFACVYALSSADIGTVGALAPQLEPALHISNVQIGVIATVAALAGAVGTLPAGVLTDRVQRINLLAVSIVLWSATMVASAFAPSFLVLVLTRVGLGAVNATSGPTIASLTGDFFPAGERARMLGLILTGELIGAGIGVVVSGDLASAAGWRVGFAWLAIPGLLLAATIWRLLLEPARGGQSRLQVGAEQLIGVEEAAASPPVDDSDPRQQLAAEQEIVRQVVRRRRLQPRRELVLSEDPASLRLPDAVRYVLSVRTNVALIVASALAYMFFAGIQTFAVEFMRSRYGLSEPAATALLVVIGLGAVAGIVLAGQLADGWLRGGRIDARVLIGAFTYLAALPLFVLGLLSPLLAISLPLFFLAAGALAAPDPTLAAARLDIMAAGLWGRAEGVRTVPHMFAFAIAPLLFGSISDELDGHNASAAAAGRAAVDPASGRALAYTFLIMLIPVAGAAISLLRARRTYPRDVATATASADAIAARRTACDTGGGTID